jgi:hypothetical protein
MKKNWWLTLLTIANAGMLFYNLLQPRPSTAADIPAVVRGRAFELVDEKGKTRAELKIFPRDPKVKMPDGTTGYPETVLLRLITSDGRPNVKIATTEDGSAVSLGGNQNPTYIQLMARGATTSVKLNNQDGTERSLRP